ncbi:MAG: hypothetical protein QOG91_504 [Candidatus Parcubacteria bacterium]|jgi:prepilin-type N-terminal cleavage/methylation domain-containing protein|nr:hypothetical protein [Candidatus Parcubacteria bacterium]
MSRSHIPCSGQKGFTAIEILVVIAIVFIITSIGLFAFISARKTKELSVLSDQIYFTLEHAKSDAVSGKNGVGAGVKFSTTTYAFFGGNVYDPANTNNKVYTVTSGYQITTTLASSDGSVVFSRIYGTPSATGTVTVADASAPTRKVDIVIGNLGDLTVIK